MMKQLTANFTYAEMIRSGEAARLGIDNTPTNEQIMNFRCLCEYVLQPLRTALGSAVVISSGFRCKELNRAVGGVSGSQHCTGEAADIVGPGWDKLDVISQISELFKWACWIVGHCPFDQLILEVKGQTAWLHVSCKADVKKNRYDVKTIIKK